MNRLSLAAVAALASLLAATSGCSHDDDGADPGAASQPPACTAGAASCECKSDGTCDPGLACMDGKCATAGTRVGLAVSDPSVRGCEIVLAEKGTRVAGVVADETARAQLVREAPLAAVSFLAAKDEPIATGAVKLTLVGGAASGVEVKKATCVDASGATVAGATVTVAQ